MAVPSARSVSHVAVVIGWLTLAIAVYLAVAAGLDDRSTAATWVCAVALWVAFGAGLIGALVPSPASLTMLRMLAPLAVVAICIAGIAGGGVPRTAVGVAVAVAFSVFVFSAPVGEAFVQASAYGAERRLPLRLPAALLVPAAVFWVCWAAVVSCAVLVLASGQWVVGVPLAVGAAAVTWFVARRFHRFAQRWLVVVPAGLVVHDHLVLMETMMVTSAQLLGVELAPADTEAADFTGPAAGHVLQITLKEMATVVLPPPRGTSQPKALHVRSFLIAPSRPGHALSALP
jgi:hypothetical protein